MEICVQWSTILYETVKRKNIRQATAAYWFNVLKICSGLSRLSLEVPNSFDRARCRNNGAITVMSSSVRTYCQPSVPFWRNVHIPAGNVPAHRARDTVQYLIHLNTCFHPTVVMATNSPVFNPLDYEVWGMLPRQFYHTRSNSIDHLKQLLVEERHCFDHRIIERTVRQWRVRLRACLCS